MPTPRNGVVATKDKIRYYLDGREVSRRRYRSWKPNWARLGLAGGAALVKPDKPNPGPDANRPGRWPHYSDAMGVHPSQVADAKKQAERVGARVDFDPKTGQAVIHDRSSYKRLAKALGLRGGYAE